MNFQNFYVKESLLSQNMDMTLKEYSDEVSSPGSFISPEKLREAFWYLRASASQNQILDQTITHLEIIIEQEITSALDNIIKLTWIFKIMDLQTYEENEFYMIYLQKIDEEGHFSCYLKSPIEVLPAKNDFMEHPFTSLC